MNNQLLQASGLHVLTMYVLTYLKTRFELNSLDSDFEWFVPLLLAFLVIPLHRTFSGHVIFVAANSDRLIY